LNVVTVTLEHSKNGPTEYNDVRLNDLLNQAGINEGAGTVTLTACNGCTNTLELAIVKACTKTITSIEIVALVCLVSLTSRCKGIYQLALKVKHP
jgi:hypothetical protein